MAPPSCTLLCVCGITADTQKITDDSAAPAMLQPGPRPPMERETGFEPATVCLEGRCATTALLPQGSVSSALGPVPGPFPAPGMAGLIAQNTSQSGREDLNLRLHRPKRCALTGLRYAPSTIVYSNRAERSNSLARKKDLAKVSMCRGTPPRTRMLSGEGPACSARRQGAGHAGVRAEPNGAVGCYRNGIHRVACQPIGRRST